jgi:hypothetical protein
MENRDEILSELRDIAPLLATIQPGELYNVPEGYFAALPYQIVERIKRPAFVLQANHLPLYTVPQGYFDGLAQNILSVIKNQAVASNRVEDELQEVAPLLNSISKQNVYAVPEQYFANFTVSTFAKATPRAKIISLKDASKWVTYVAASFIGVVLFTGVFFFNGKHKTFDYDRYSNMNIGVGDNGKVQVKGDEEAPTQYLEEGAAEQNLDNSIENQKTLDVAAVEAPEAADTNYISLPNIQETLKSFSDEALQEYLKENEISDDTKVVDSTDGI